MDTPTSTCNHQWRQSGLWDGQDPVTNRPTGGVMLRCDLCKKQVMTRSEAQALGGTFIENTNIYGQPLPKKS